jgi:peptidoglycan/LPS O-acetylase OafA/YrhL
VGFADVGESAGIGFANLLKCATTCKHYHLPIFGWMYARPSAAAAFGAILLAFAAATASYLLLERPLLRWARRRPPGGAAAA